MAHIRRSIVVKLKKKKQIVKISKTKPHRERELYALQAKNQIVQLAIFFLSNGKKVKSDFMIDLFFDYRCIFL